ncbi:MAG: hypothetical protein WAU49_13885 [Steroidobacteraceae bacterium]
MDRYALTKRRQPEGDFAGRLHSNGFRRSSFLELDAEVVVGAVLETPRGVENAQAIMAVPGIGIIFQGKIELGIRRRPINGTLQDVEDDLLALAGLAKHEGKSIAAAAADTAAARTYSAAGCNVLFTALSPLMMRSLTNFTQLCASASAAGKVDEDRSPEDRGGG